MLLEPRHVAGEKAPIGADGVAAERRLTGLGHPLRHIGHDLGLGILQGGPRGQGIEETRPGVHLAHEVTHLGQETPRVGG